MSDLGQLEQLELWLQTLEDKLPDIAAEAAPELQSQALASYARGQSPDGTAWPTRKKDGGLALQRPASTVTCAGVGAEIRFSAEDILRYHQGPMVTSRNPVRAVFPHDDDPMPPAWEEIITDTARDVLPKGAPIA